MEFEFVIPEDAQLQAHNLKYVKTVMDYFDERQCEDFRNSALDLQEYALVTGLRCSLFPEGDDFDRLIERKRFRGSFASKFQKAKRRKEKEIICTVHDFPITMQVWTYEAISNIGKRFGIELVNECHDFFPGPHENSHSILHVYAILRSTDAEAEQPYFSTLMSYDDPLVPVLDDIARIVLAP
ncbi:Hypothetical predicted protein [Olea europaea subsp. europaea]|uniref:Uncharacterized protein n=1 Tax=Olea europaea subsp. europaea TaxID=158383 RepID=A0A8S0UAV8_OLEEU|nr:Hypothetical predicted protein [Olea europaea subsp. europaea]